MLTTPDEGRRMNGSMTAVAPYRHVVVATDGSPFSANALVGGALLAQRTNADLHVFHASSGSDVPVESQAAALLDQP